MYKIRIVALSLIIALLLPIVAIPAQVRASSDTITALTRLAGSSAPVLTAITECTIAELLDNGDRYVKEAISEANGILEAHVTDEDVADASDVIQQTAQRAKNKELCITPIEKAATQVILSTLTTMTVNAINTGGIGGAPQYVQDANKMIKSMQDSQIADFADSLANDPDSYPFGKDILRDTLTQLNSTSGSFAETSKSTLLGVIQENNGDLTADDFTSDLKSGGWDAFDAGFNMNNNPIGFNSLVQNHVSSLLGYGGPSYSEGSPEQALKDELNWGHGFLSQKKCLDPGYDPTSTTTTICSNSQITTPGDTISLNLSKALGSQVDSLNLGQGLDAGLTAVFNAMLSKMLKDGLTSLSDDSGASNASFSGSTIGSGSQNSNPTVTGNATAGSLCQVNSADSWYTQFPKFNLWDGVGLPALKAREENLGTVITQENTVLNLIIIALYNLDLCIPGPSNMAASIKQAAFGQIMQDYNPVSGTSPQIIEAYNAQFLSDHLSIRYFPDSKIKTATQVQKIVKTVISRYYDAMIYQYSNLNDLDSAPQSLVEIKKLTMYTQMQADNTAKLALINGNVHAIQHLIDRINAYSTAGDDANFDKKKSIEDSFNGLIPQLDVSPYSNSSTSTSYGSGGP